VQLDECELRGAIDGHEHVQLAFLGAHLGDVNVEIADRIGLELLPGLLAFDAWQARDVVALKQAMQRGPCQMGNARLQRIPPVKAALRGEA
jgi:hypothetical protein